MTILAIDVRQAEPDDAQAISEAHRVAWQHAFAGLIPHRELMSMIERRGDQWWLHAIQGSSIILVLEVGGSIAGYATMGHNRIRSLPLEGEIYELYLRPEYQGVGLGSRLFRDAKQVLASKGCKGLIVWTLAENNGAVSFCSALGGREIAAGTENFELRRLKKVAYAWS